MKGRYSLMILLVGDEADSILYFKNRIELTEEYDLPLGMHAYSGKIGGEEVLITCVGRGNMLSSLRTGYLLERFSPYVCISIGTVYSLRNDLHQGDLFIADRHYNYGVDFSTDGKTVYGQIPEEPPFYNASSTLNDTAEAMAYQVGGAYVERGFLLSGDKDYVDLSAFQGIIARHYNGTEKMACYDTNSGGIALSCRHYKTALLTLKVVSYEPLRPEQLLSKKRKGLESMGLLSEILVAMLVNTQRSL